MMNHSERVIHSLVVMALVISVVWFAKSSYIEAKAVLGQWLLERAWSKLQALSASVDGSVGVDGAIRTDGHQKHYPWPWADTYPVARIVIPTLDVDQIALSGDSGEALSFGPGVSVFQTGSARQDETGQLGEGSVMLFQGHRDTHFNYVPELERGDEITVYFQNEAFRFEVSSLHRVSDPELYLDLSADTRPILILSTCTLDGFVSDPSVNDAVNNDDLEASWLTQRFSIRGAEQDEELGRFVVLAQAVD